MQWPSRRRGAVGLHDNDIVGKAIARIPFWYIPGIRCRHVCRIYLLYTGFTGALYYTRYLVPGSRYFGTYGSSVRVPSDAADMPSAERRHVRMNIACLSLLCGTC